LRAPLAARQGGSSLYELLQVHGRILTALIIRDVQTRFFGTALGFILAILWPVSHIFLLIFINGALGRPAPYGDSAPLFFATGLLPFMCFNYMSRFTCLGVMLNKPLLGFPIVKVGDLLIARGILEVLNAAVVVIVTIVILTAMGVNVWPPRPLEAMYAMLACMTLGFGFGMVNGVRLSFNPILIGVEWMRSAFYEGYGLNELLDKHYLLGFATVSILLGLVMERTMRGVIMQG